MDIDKIKLQMNATSTRLQDLDSGFLRVLTTLTNDALAHGVGCNAGIIRFDKSIQNRKESCDYYSDVLLGVYMDEQAVCTNDDYVVKMYNIRLIGHIATVETGDAVEMTVLFAPDLFANISKRYGYDPMTMEGRRITLSPLTTSEVVEAFIESAKEVVSEFSKNAQNLLVQEYQEERDACNQR